MTSLLALLLLAAPVIPDVGPDAGPRSGVPAVLRAYEYVPVAARPNSTARTALRRAAADELEDPVVRGRALTLLASTGDVDAQPLVQRLLSASAEPFVRRKAVEAWAVLGGPRALPDVAALFQSAAGDRRLRAACARALSTLGTPAAAVRARLHTRETDPEIRSLLAPDPRSRKDPR